MAGGGYESPRQKMINLMYIVLLAMLALNVSSDVLNGFSLVDESLNRSKKNSTIQNNSIYEELDYFMEKNPEKVKVWYDRAQEVKHMSDSLYNYIEDLKIRIVKQADGEDGDIYNIQNREDLEAASYIMLAPNRGEGKNLYNHINYYKEQMLNMIKDSVQHNIISDNFNTTVPDKEDNKGKNWQEYIFENTPTAAAVTLLTKYQNDIRYAEGEVIHTLVNNIDIGDLRVNEINAYVIPNSQTIVRGGKFEANIILAAVDSTQKPNIYINDKLLPMENNGVYETICTDLQRHRTFGYRIGHYDEHALCRIRQPHKHICAGILQQPDIGHHDKRHATEKRNRICSPPGRDRQRCSNKGIGQDNRRQDTADGRIYVQSETAARPYPVHRIRRQRHTEKISRRHRPAQISADEHRRHHCRHR